MIMINCIKSGCNNVPLMILLLCNKASESILFKIMTVELLYRSKGQHVNYKIPEP